MKIISVVGARPNFMKIAPFIKAIEANNRKNDRPIQHVLVHTGQHYDDQMSRVFFNSLDIPDADINLGVGSGSHAEQVGRTMIEFEKVIWREKPDWVVVVGDVNATCACSITAKKEHVKCAHIEAGLRSGDMTMPEEINRLVTDRLSDLLFAPDRFSVENLCKEGVAEERVHLVGNIMIDTLEAQMARADRLDPCQIVSSALLDRQMGLSPEQERSLHNGQAALMTMHRPSNVDDPRILKPIIELLIDEVCRDMLLLWPVHPRAVQRMQEFYLWKESIENPNFLLLNPLGYHELLKLNRKAAIMLTDSGGLQEECCVLGTPCLTLRCNTERPVTLQAHGGAAVLVGNNIDRIRDEYRKMRTMKLEPTRPELWDGKTAGRIVDVLATTWRNS